MFGTHALAVQRLPKHSGGTCGKSRGGGFRTSNSGRRSRFLGRVAVTHVQGPPKGGGALGPLRVLNTRLSPVPPTLWEGIGMTGRGSIMKTSIVGAVALAIAGCSAGSPAEGNAASNISAEVSQAAAAPASSSVDISPFISPNNGEGETVMLDDMPDSASPACDGDVWTFNTNGSGTFSRLEGGAGIESSGRYQFDGKTLHLLEVARQVYGEANSSPAKDLVLSVSKTHPYGRVTIGRVSYRICAPTGGVPQENEQSQPSPEPSQVGQDVAITCKSLEAEVANTIAARTKHQVIEIDTDKEESVGGELKCSGVAIIDAGKLLIDFGTETTPKGQRMTRVNWEPMPLFGRP